MESGVTLIKSVNESDWKTTHELLLACEDNLISEFKKIESLTPSYISEFNAPISDESAFLISKTCTDRAKYNNNQKNTGRNNFGNTSINDAGIHTSAQMFATNETSKFGMKSGQSWHSKYRLDTDENGGRGDVTQHNQTQKNVS